MLFMHLLYAKDISINELITQIKQSTGDIKRQKMNLLKIKLRDANQKTRQEAISKLQKNMHIKGNKNFNQLKGLHTRGYNTKRPYKPSLHNQNHNNPTPHRGGGKH